MFADPQTITVGAVPHTLPRVGSPKPQTVGVFTNGDQTMTVNVHQNQTSNRFRREFRVTSSKVAADPITNANTRASASVIIAFDEPKSGFTDAELLDLLTGAVAQLTASTNAKAKQLLAGEL